MKTLNWRLSLAELRALMEIPPSNVFRGKAAFYARVNVTHLLSMLPFRNGQIAADFNL